MDKEFEKWLRIDPELRLPKWVKSDEGKSVLVVIVGAGVYAGVAILAIVFLP